MKRILILSILAMFPANSNVKACTAFCMNDSGIVLLAKNLDWSIDRGMIFYNPPGCYKYSISPGSEDFSWISGYGSITFNQFGKEFPLGGMNERGLVVEELSCPSDRSSEKPAGASLNEFQLVQYLLDNYASISEIMEDIQNLELQFLLFPLHYILTDSTGDCLILEPLGPRLRAFHPPANGPPVLSNNPYPESLRYLKNFKGFGGSMPILHRKGSNERFVSAVSMLSGSASPPSVNRAQRMLDTLKQEDTRWSLVYDASNRGVHVKFHACDKAWCLDLKAMTKGKMARGAGRDISICREGGTHSFKPCTAIENSRLISEVKALLPMF